MSLRAIYPVAVLLLCAQFLSSSSVDRAASRHSADPAGYRVVVPSFESPPKIDGKLDRIMVQQDTILDKLQ